MVNLKVHLFGTLVKLSVNHAELGAKVLKCICLQFDLIYSLIFLSPDFWVYSNVADPLFIYLVPLFIHSLNKYLSAYYSICQGTKGFRDAQVSLLRSVNNLIQEDTE